MHILFTVNAAWNLVHFRRTLIRNLIADGHKVTALVPIDEHVEQLRAMKCDVVPLEMDSKGLSPLANMKMALRMRAVFREKKPDVVLSFTIKNNIFGAYASHGLPLQFIPNITGLGTAFLGSKRLQTVVKMMYRRAFRPLPHIIFQNDDDRKLFESMELTRPEQAVVVPGSGIDLALFDYSAPSAKQGETMTFLMIARILADKGVREYAEAARMVKARYPEVKFQLIGPLDSVNRTALPASEVEGWVAEGIIDYRGKLDDVRPSIAAADCVVLPSYREGLPRTLLEGAATGRAIVTTDVPGCRSVVRQGETGLLCAPHSGYDLARALEAMICLHPEERVSMGKKARKHIEERFGVDRVVAIYRDLIGRASKSGLATLAPKELKELKEERA